MELIELTATIRTTKGNGAARVLRRNAQIPAVLYGPGNDPILLSINTKELELALKNIPAAQALINLKIDSDTTASRSAMIKELQIHPLSQDYLHADFYQIDMARKIKIRIPVVTKGHSTGVEMGGILQIVRRELEISCLPNAIPEAIELDVTDLDIGDAIHVEDIALGDDVEISADTNFTVITVSSPKVEEEPEVEVEEGEEGEEVEEVEGEAATEGKGEPEATTETKDKKED
ncbi:MAG: 50S ribosomal protein L25/general stress protein Ctc [Desulfobacterales bacterium]